MLVSYVNMVGLDIPFIMPD